MLYNVVDFEAADSHGEGPRIADCRYLQENEVRAEERNEVQRGTRLQVQRRTGGNPEFHSLFSRIQGHWN